MVPSLARLLTAPFAYRPWLPLHIRLVTSDMRGRAAQPVRPHADHLRGAIEWLCRAQDARVNCTDAGGVSAGWSFENGWLPGYPETTGYIIETFLEAASLLDDDSLRQRAHRMLDWELSLQHANGAFPGHYGEPGSQPVVFNTGQIIHGMLAGYLCLGREECLVSALRAAVWMAEQQDSDGCWRRFEYRSIPHVYNTRATWAMIRTAQASGERKLLAPAVRNLDWALSQQQTSGWLATNTFTAGADPVTHTIAYAIRGFLESGLLLNEQRYVDAAIKAAGALSRAMGHDGWLAGTYDVAWRPSASYCCVTGVAQMALCWLRLEQACGLDEMRDSARLAIDFVKRTQRLDDPAETVRGGIPGSSPIWGAYARFEYPNWAAKFFADALMMDEWDVSIPPTERQAAAATV
jgi:hypothetical protein